MAVNLAKHYSSKVSERFSTKSLTDAAINKNYNFIGAATVVVQSFPTTPLVNYDRTAAANRFGTPAELQDTIQEFTVTQDKAFTFVVDSGNEVQSAGTRNANKALSRQVDEVIIPYVDTYRLAVMGTAAVAAGGTATAAVTTANAYSKLLAATAYFGNNDVPVTNRIAFVSYDFYNLLKQDTSFMKNSDLAQGLIINGQVGEVDGMKIVPVPSTRLPANTAFIAVHKDVVCSPEQLRTLRILKDQQGIDGAIVEGRIVFDAFVDASRNKGVYIHKIA